MIKSMTGYGKGQSDIFIVEIRSVNHKYLDLAIRMPKSLNALEGLIRKTVAEKLSRGRVEITITKHQTETASAKFSIDIPSIRTYVESLRKIKQELDLPGEIEMSAIITNRDLFVSEQDETDMDALAEPLTVALTNCLYAIDRMRAEEGSVLAADILKRIAIIKEAFGQVEKRAPQTIIDYRYRLTEKIRKLVDKPDLDETRLETEIAVMADRCDITEEVVRANTHIYRLSELIKTGGVVGKKADFLLQELFREINTTGSKAQDIEISKHVVAMKAELEKIREQIQNIE